VFPLDRPCSPLLKPPPLLQTSKPKSLDNSSDLMIKNTIVPAHTPLQIAWVDGEWSEVGDKSKIDFDLNKSFTWQNLNKNIYRSLFILMFIIVICLMLYFILV